jgi:hypothetical protein
VFRSGIETEVEIYPEDGGSRFLLKIHIGLYEVTFQKSVTTMNSIFILINTLEPR